MKTLLTCCLLLIFAGVNAQKTVSGIVKDAKGELLFGATVNEKGTNNTTLTNVGGAFFLKYADEKAILVISYFGYVTAEVAIAGNEKLEVTLEEVTNLEGVAIIGTRKLNRVATETPVPIDIIDLKDAKSIGNATQLLQDAVPSLNYNKQSGSDGADHIDLATLRGLGPDQTLVLINGKRRHQTAYVALFGTRGRGNSGTDMSSIPVSAIDHIEILRDGASAQYGSDAIAGAVNIVLKKNKNEFTGDFGYGANYDNTYNTAFKPELGQYVTGNKLDGNTFNFNGNYGIGLGENNGFLNLSLNYRQSAKTFRQVLDTSNLYTNDAALPLNPYRRANGDASFNSIGGFFNLELPFKNKQTVFYGFGGATSKNSDAYAFSRNWTARPDRFPTDSNGDLIYVDGIMTTTPDSSEIYYNPHIQTKIMDVSACFGLKGQFKNNWNWDISNVTGNNTFHFYGDKTFNASLGSSQTHFDDGGFSFLQSTTNFNTSKEFKGIAQGLNLAMGAEYRYENYSIVAGEEASYKNYDTLKATGAQGFPGYQPNDEVNASRSVVGVFADAEIDLTTRFLVTGAVRMENYSDFGFTHNYKLASRYKLNEKFMLRASGSTGFRAPSLQQINFSSTFTTVQGSTISEVKIAPNYSTIAQAAGIPNLKQEKSVNLGVGFTLTPVRNLKITVDAYQVQVKDRVVLSGQFDASDATLNSALTTEMQNLNVGLAQFFVNAVNTTNRGIDLVVDYKWVTNKNILRASVATNLQQMTIDKINVPEKLNDTPEHQQTFLSDREKAFILASAPNSKMIVKLQYERGKYSIGTRATYFGKVTLLGYGESGLGINPEVPTDQDASIYVKDQYIYSGKLVNDLFATYKIHKLLTLELGVNNLLNVHPDLGAVKSAKWWAYNTETGGAWDAVQMGFSGRFLYTKLSFKF